MKTKFVSKLLSLLIISFSMNTYADWALSDQESKELPTQYHHAVNAAKFNSFEKVKNIAEISPWNHKLTFNADHTKILMTAVVPKWCIDAQIYAKGKTYTSPEWPFKIMVDNHDWLIKETKIYMKFGHPLLKSKEWTGEWTARFDESGKFIEKRPKLNLDYITTHHSPEYAEKLDHLVNETESKIVQINKAHHEYKHDLLIVYEDLKDDWVSQRDILKRHFTEHSDVDRNLLDESDRKKLSSQRLIWMSPYPEIKDYLKPIKEDRERNMKVRLFTGLPVTKNIPTQYAVDMWVNVQDLIRPCPDTDVLEKTCFPSPPYTPNNEEFKSIKDIFTYTTRSDDLTYEFWFKSNTEYAYSGDWPFPWTRLGYTYNWDDEAHDYQGVSEFFLRPGATVQVENVTELKEY